MQKSDKSNPIIFKNHEIGSMDAENDEEFLSNCFIENESLNNIRDINSSKMILLGRTGSGKTAILRHLESTEENVVVVDLLQRSMDYVANSDILRFFKSLEVDLDVIFQVLWKHILCIEYIRLRYNVHNESQSRNCFERISEFFQNRREKSAALDYLKNWEREFWISMDENIVTLTERIENQAKAEFGGDVFKKFQMNAGYINSLGKERKAQYQNRAKNVVNFAQLKDLNRVLELLAEYDNNSRKKSYILIDKIDERWVDESIRFDLIRALIESLKAFRRVKCMKIIVALRTDVLERVRDETKDVGFQSEKYEDYFEHVKWEEGLLYDLINKRINHLFHRKYTKENIQFNNIFPDRIGKENAFSYIAKRTLLRPRDLISFVNIILKQAEGEKNILSARHIRLAETIYSQKRFDALISEWKSALPSLNIVLSEFSGKSKYINLNELSSKDVIDHLVLRITNENENENVIVKYESFSLLAKDYLDEKINEFTFAKEIVFQLYRIGALGIKLNPNQQYLYSHISSNTLNKESIIADVKICIHPMLRSALNINPKENRD